MKDERTGREVNWPHGLEQESSSQPLVFNPKGFLVAILPDAAVAEEARTALETSGLSADDLRVYTCEEILKEHERYLKERGMARTILSRITERESDFEFYAGHASEGHAALWVHVTDRHDASRAIRFLADHGTLHYRYFGHDEEIDIPDQQP